SDSPIQEQGLDCPARTEMRALRGGILRYPGGKYRVREQLAMFFIQAAAIYNGFFGGGHVDLLLAAMNHMITAFDVNLQLVNFWQIALKYPQDLADYIERRYLGRMTKELFNDLQAKLRRCPT